MNQLQEHLKFVESLRRSRRSRHFATLFGWGLALAVFAYVAYAAAPRLNANAGAATVVLTAVLIAITAYYAWWTRRIVSIEERRRIEDARPLLIFHARGLNYEPLQQIERLNCALQIDLTCQNAVAINVHVRVEIPIRNAEDTSLRGLTAKPEPAFFGAIASGEQVALAVACSVRPEEIPTSKSATHFIVINAACEDRLQNYYQHCVYFEIHRTSANPDSSEPTLIRRYEETRFISADKRALLLTDAFGYVEPHLETVEVLVQRRGGIPP